MPNDFEASFLFMEANKLFVESNELLKQTEELLGDVTDRYGFDFGFDISDIENDENSD